LSPKRKILVIDDDKDMLTMLEAILLLDGYEVLLCNDPDEALDRTREGRPDLVILDMMMPRKSGLEVMMDMRREPETKDVPVLFLSAVGDESVVVKALKGADDYVIKPFKTLELEARIEKILDRAGDASRPREAPKKLNRLPVQRGDETFLVPLSEIYYFEAAGKYSYAHTTGKKFLTGFSLGQLEERLSGDTFLRTHRSYIVNLDFVKKLSKHKVHGTRIVLADGEETHVKVSESRLPEIREMLGI
jgi:DNA-binding LytR/AlgR family response regulator